MAFRISLNFPVFPTAPQRQLEDQRLQSRVHQDHRVHYKCQYPLCGRDFGTNRRAFERHTLPAPLTHHDLGRYSHTDENGRAVPKCRDCDRVFDTLQELADHLRSDPAHSVTGQQRQGRERRQQQQLELQAQRNAAQSELFYQAGIQQLQREQVQQQQHIQNSQGYSAGFGAYLNTFNLFSTIMSSGTSITVQSHATQPTPAQQTPVSNPGPSQTLPVRSAMPSRDRQTRPARFVEPANAGSHRNGSSALGSAPETTLSGSAQGDSAARNPSTVTSAHAHSTTQITKSSVGKQDDSASSNSGNTCGKAALGSTQMTASCGNEHPPASTNPCTVGSENDAPDLTLIALLPGSDQDDPASRNSSSVGTENVPGPASTTTLPSHKRDVWSNLVNPRSDNSLGSAGKRDVWKGFLDIGTENGLGSASTTICSVANKDPPAPSNSANAMLRLPSPPRRYLAPRSIVARLPVFGPPTLQDELSAMAAKLEAANVEIQKCKRDAMVHKEEMTDVTAKLEAANVQIQGFIDNMDHQASLRQCTVCFERETDTIVKCGHQFCQTCINSWLQQSDRQPWQTPCPLCRKATGKPIKIFQHEASQKMPPHASDRLM